MALIERLVPKIVDTVLHHLVWTLEQVEDVDIAVHLSERFRTEPPRSD